MKTLKTKLEKKGVYFSTKLPSHPQISKILNIQKTTSKGIMDLSKSFQSSSPRKKEKINRKLLSSWKEQSKHAQYNNKVSPLVICDRKLQQYPEVNTWLKNYPVYFVSAGEKLKNIDFFPTHINKILKISTHKKLSGFISLGGGSVGDFTGFIASVYKRGVPLIHIPSTWLSAMDSAHGGKTALNTKEIKNIIGSYCFPKAVFIVKKLLYQTGREKGLTKASTHFEKKKKQIEKAKGTLPFLSEKEKKSAEGELVKIALIVGGTFYKEVLKKYLIKKSFSHLDLWLLLPQAILSKLKIVEEDPYEKKGLRLLLNLGHTLGHALESYFKIPHGQAVLYGITFATHWSHRRFTLSPLFLKEMSFFIEKQKKLAFYFRKIPLPTLAELLLQDKKRVNKDRVNFIFLKGSGRVFVEEISVQKIIKEVQRQSFL
ncbi:MAG: 3-dehydroquinate synthase [Bdellovibrionales bacterium]|nr:3-dehydroquinate synthase [Bdellovibrionales bacterium]